MIDSNRTIGIVCGASEWPYLPNFESAEAFDNTARNVRNYLAGENGLSLRPENTLWLFNEPDAVQQYDRIFNFLTQRLAALNAPNGSGTLVLFWYIGHGAFFESDRDYCLLVRGTRAPIEMITSLRVATLAKIFRKVAQRSARTLILDCCFAGEAAISFQGSLDQAVAAKASQAVETDHGVALLCAASARNPAQLEDKSTMTLFGRAVLEVLTRGDQSVFGAMSLRDLSRLANLKLSSYEVEDPPRSEVHSPDQAGGDLAARPLFPNPAAPPRVFEATSSAVNTQLGAEKSQGLSSVSRNKLCLSDLLTNDPARAYNAARAVVKGGQVDVAALVKVVPRNEFVARIVRFALAAAPETSADLILRRIRAASDNWRDAAEAVDKLSPAHLPFVKDGLMSIAQSRDRDAAYLAVDGLGRAGAASCAVYVRELAERDTEEMDRNAGNTARALARMIRFCDETGTASDAHRDAATHALGNFLIRNYGSPHLSNLWDVYYSLRRLRPWHADVLLESYLGADSDLLVELAATAVGHMRLSRARSAINSRISEVGAQAQAKLLEELGRIGGIPSFEILRAHAESGSLGDAARLGLSICLEFAPEDEFETLARDLLNCPPQFRWWIFRAIGVRQWEPLLRALEDGLDDPLDVNRGVAAIALARVLGPESSERTMTARAEAASPNERFLTTVAALQASGQTSLVGELAAPAVASNVWDYESALLDDVFAVLDNVGEQPGCELADSLRWVRTAP
ncbi:caspase family protein [Streptomyces sp. NPDC053429]|uniref:caspase family protein n=1 Tax=Streptomyces sp. NPDC053429 TaxID=3365702 RepID=UPI0037CDCA3F